MKKIVSLVLLVMLSGFIFTSCVSKKKYLASQSRASRLHRDSVDFYDQIMALQGKVSRMNEENNMTSNRLNKSQMELSKKEEQLSETQQTVAAQQRRLMELQQLLEQQRKNTEALRKTIADAMVNFNASQLTVSIKNGKVYVSMEESLLFPSGSAVVNKEGKSALSSLAAVLNQNNDININIEGHTDSIPITKKYEDNWALSVARSTAIARILIQDYSVAPARIITSGRSQYFPIADNNTTEGRSKNRRTEIILEPKLDRIMELVEGSTAAGR